MTGRSPPPTSGTGRRSGCASSRPSREASRRSSTTSGCRDSSCRCAIRARRSALCASRASSGPSASSTVPAASASATISTRGSPTSSTPSSIWIGPGPSSPSTGSSAGVRSSRQKASLRAYSKSVDARAYDVVVVGKANMDYLVRGPRLPLPGQSVNGDLFQQAPGGKGANQAVAAARLGARVALISRIGNDARGDSVVEALLTEGVALDHLVRDPSAPTGVALCQVGGNGEKQILSAAGANGRLTVDDVRAARDALTSTAVVLMSLGVPTDCVAEAIELAKAGGAR